MKAVLKREGDVFTVTVPESVIDATGFREGVDLDVRSESGRLIIRRRVDLDELLDQIEGPPPPGVWDDIEPKGSDIW